MKGLSPFLQRIGFNGTNAVEPNVLWYLQDHPLSYIPILIQIQKGLSSSIEKKLKRLGCKNILYFPIIEAFFCVAPLSSIRKLMAIPTITYISMNHKIYAYMDKITEKLGSFQVNQFGISGRNVVIAHLDTGIHPHRDLTHPRNRIIYFKDFIQHSTHPYDDHGHGTLCAGCMAGNGNASKGQYKGISPEVHLIGLKCLDKAGTGDVKTALQALQWVLDHKEKYHIQIVHIPFGINNPHGSTKDPLVRAVERIWQEGIVVICAAGNGGPHRASISSPGISEKVITVGSATKDPTPNTSNAISDFSSRGPTPLGISKPNLTIPGERITSLHYETNHGSNSRPYISFSGTSASSSIVAGAVALLLEKYPHFTPEEVKLALEMSCQSLHLEKNMQGKGILNIEKLLTTDFS